MEIMVKLINFGNVNSMIINPIEIEKPKLGIITTKISSLNSLAYLPGKYTWIPIKLIIQDIDQIRNLVNQQVQKQTDAFSDNLPHTKEFKFNILITTTENKEFMELCSIEQCFIQNIEYEDSDQPKIIMTIAYNNAIIKGEFD